MTTIADSTFAAACFDQNSIAELEQALAGQVDVTDCAEWNLTPEQWRAEIELALAAKRENA
jgi:hypothetical protein